MQFQKAKDARAFFEGVILDIPQSMWSDVMHSWFESKAKCVQDGVGRVVLCKTRADGFVLSLVEKPDCIT